MRKRRRAVQMQVLRALVTGSIACLAMASPVLAKPAWDQAANIKDAAERLGVLHRSQGSQGVVKFLDACYKVQTLASQFTQGLEACMAQDYMHSRILAEIYAKLPEEGRRKLKAPSPEFIARTMNARFATILTQYKLQPSDAQALEKAIEKHGLPVFIKAAFPSKNRGEQENGDGKSGGK